MQRLPHYRQRHESNFSWPIALAGLAGVGVVGYLAAKAVVRRTRYFDLDGKVAIVTGGSRGIGLAIARELAKRHARVAICARDEAELRDARQQLEELGAQTLAITCDVTQQDEIASVVEQTVEHFGRIDVLVNNAGIISVGPVAHMKISDYRDAMDVNFEGPLLFILQTLPHLRKSNGGRIVNIASFGGKVPVPHMAPYCASKFALVGLSESLRTELVDDGIYVTTVCPGLVRSGSAGHAQFKGQQQKEFDWFSRGAKSHLITIAPEDLAYKIVNALQAGDAELITPLVARIETLLHGLSPALMTEAGSLINGLLPGRASGSDGDHARPGSDFQAGQ